MRKVIRVLNRINSISYFILCLVIIFLVAIVFYDVVGRYFFKNPTSFGFELSNWFMALFTFMGGGYAIYKNENIRVDLFYEKYSIKGRSLVGIISDLVYLLVAFIFIKYGLDQTLNYLAQGAVANSGFNVALWIKWVIMPLGGILLAIQALIQLFFDVFALVNGRSHEEDLTGKELENK